MLVQNVRNTSFIQNFSVLGLFEEHFPGDVHCESRGIWIDSLAVEIREALIVESVSQVMVQLVLLIEEQATVVWDFPIVSLIFLKAQVSV